VSRILWNLTRGFEWPNRLEKIDLAQFREKQVVHSLIPALTSLLFVVAARADLQLTPRISHYEGDGVKFTRLAFSDGGVKEITYSLPHGWDYSGNANTLTLHPPNKSQAEAIISRPVSQSPRGSTMRP
jgi:hypothetical protein